MAGLETVHHVVEKLDVKGVETSVAAFGKVSKAAQGFAKLLGYAQEKGYSIEHAMKDAGFQAEKSGDQIANAGDKSSEGLDDAGDSADKTGGKIEKGGLKAKAAAIALELLGKAARYVYAKMWETNLVVDDLTDVTQGLVLATMKLEAQDPAGRFRESAIIAKAMMGDFRDIAMDTATPIAEIQGLSKDVQVLWAAAGKSQLDVLKGTRATAAAAKVLGVGMDQAANSVQRLIMSGRAGRGDTFGIAVAAEAGIKKTDKLEERIAKVQKAMEKIGAPVKELTQGTEEAMTRWRILTDDVLQRATKPLFDKIGERIQSIVDYAEQHKDTIDDTITTVHVWIDKVTSVADGLIDAGKAVWELRKEGTFVYGVFDSLAGGPLRAVLEVVDLIGEGARLVKDAFSDAPEAAQRFEVTLQNVYTKIMKVVHALTTFLDYLPELDENMTVFGVGISDEDKAIIRGLKRAKNWHKEFGENLEEREKITDWQQEQLGMKRTTDVGRAAENAAAGMSKADAQNMLSKVFGSKRPLFEMNVRELNIRNEFRDSDPDAVMVQLVDGFHSLAERALQSSSGGGATTFGPGGD